MCCSSKKKSTVPVNNGVQGQSNLQVQQTTPQVITTSQTNIYNSNKKLPKSTISYAANDYEQSNLQNREVFVSTQKVAVQAQDLGDRHEDYAVEVNRANESKLLQPTNLLTYDLDQGDGVSRVPVINTFHYESSLQHCFLANYTQNQSYLRNSGASNNLNGPSQGYVPNGETVTYTQNGEVINSRVSNNSGIYSQNQVVNNSGIHNQNLNNSIHSNGSQLRGDNARYVSNVNGSQLREQESGISRKSGH